VANQLLTKTRGGLVMALTKNSICDFGWKARDFVLKGVDGKTYTLADVYTHFRQSIDRINNCVAACPDR
jgi:hypothetical protein